MTTFTDKELIKEIKERIGSLDVRDNIERRAYEIALASLEADPVAYIFKHPAGKLFWALTDESNKEQADVIPVYAAPPVPVVPEEKTMPNPLKMYAVDAVAAIAEVRGWNSCRAAMLHGAEPVSQTYKSQHTQFEQVADLYEMQFDDGRTCAFHTDAQKAAQWLQACDGNRVQEYVKLERLRNALSGNYPVTPDGWISCSERMPEDTKMLLAFSQGEIVAAYWNWVVNPIDYKKYRAFTYLSGNILDDVTHWMPLPEPPQEVK
ncbi:TPA: DUF551 domain-containing protein [Escherichia coli]|nr:DUF551 domain-containing protein [Escherichia coli]HCO7122023.1 DUF551 domain-containing protein [Escherichia coli]